MKFLLRILLLSLLMALAAAQDLKIYTEEDPPYNFSGPEGNPAGFGVEVVEALQRRLGTSFQIQILPWARAYRNALNEAGVMVFMMGRTPEREHLFQWVGPLINNDWILVGRRRNAPAVATLRQAAMLPAIGVVRDFASASFLSAQGFTNLQPVTTNKQNVLKLKAGRISAYVSTNNNFLAEIAEAGESPQDFAPIFTLRSVALYCAFSKDVAPEIVARWQKALDAMRADGSLTRLQNHWFPPVKSATKQR